MLKLSVYCRFLLLSLLVLCAGMPAIAATEPYQHSLQGKIKKGDTLIVKDEKFQNAAFKWSLIRNLSVNNIVTFGLYRDQEALPNKKFSCKVDLKIEYWSQPDQADPITEDHVELEISYDPRAGVVYQAEKAYQFKNGHRVKLTVNDITSAELGDELPDVFRLTNMVSIERQYLRDPEDTTKRTPYVIPVAALPSGGMTTFGFQPPVESDGEVLIGWDEILGAEDYDLEWTFVSSPIITGEAPGTPAGEYPQLFRKGATRVTIHGHQYPITIVHDMGYLVVRVRGVYYAGEKRSEFDWEPALIHTISTPRHMENMNWQYNATYAEEGKKKEVVSYVDGGGKTRQTLTVANPGANSSDVEGRYAVVQENVYDEFGRPALSILPAPIKETEFKYYGGLHLNAAGQPYNFQNMYGANTACQNTPDPMFAPAASPGKGAAGYYSANNPFKNDVINNKFIPDAGGYPFSVTRYMPDNTGRVSVQGGVGLTFQPGGKATRIYYGKPEAWELDRLFGNDVGYAHHYLKTMTVSPDGQIAISYTNASGQTIATALAGAKPANLDKLDSQHEPEDKTTVLLTPAQFKFDHTKLTLTASANYMVAVPNEEFKVSYNISRLIHQYNAGGFEICSNCYYTLKITVSDDCGNSEVKLNTFVGSKSANCSLNGNEIGFITHTPPTEGTYYIRFELGLSQDVIGAYTDEYLRKNTDLRSRFSFILEELDNLDFQACIADCQSCRATLGEKPAFIQRVKDQFALQEVSMETYGTDVETWASGMYDALLEHCNMISTQCDASPCAETKSQMLLDVSPGGQYALFTENFSALEPAINVVSNNWRSVFDILEPNTAPYIREQVELEDGTITSPHDANFTLAQLIKYWKPAYAEKFLRFHPEQCMLTNCEELKQYMSWDNRLKTEILSAAKIGQLQPGLQYDHAVADWLMNADPFFQPGAPGEYDAFYMRSGLTSYSLNKGLPAPSKGLTQFVDYFLYCADRGGNTNTGTDENTWTDCVPDPLCRVPDREWIMYRNKYLELKEEVYQRVRVRECPNNVANCGGLWLQPLTGNCPTPAMFSFYEMGVETIPGFGTFLRIGLRFNGGVAPFSEVQVNYKYPDNDVDQAVKVIWFQPGSGGVATARVPVGLDVNKIRILSTWCTPVTTAPSECNGIAGTITLSSAGAQAAQHTFTDVENGIPVQYHIRKGYSDEQPNLADFCPGASAEFYNCLEVKITGIDAPYRYFNVWVITCYTGGGPCTPALYNMEVQIGTGKYYADGKYYYFGITPDCGNPQLLAEHNCAEVFLPGSTTPVQFSGNGTEPLEVYICPDCTGPSNSLAASSLIQENGNQAAYLSGTGTYLIFSNTGPSDVIDPGDGGTPIVTCSNPLRNWYACFTVIEGGTSKVYKNATVFQCMSGGETCTPDVIFNVTASTGTNDHPSYTTSGDHERNYMLNVVDGECDEELGYTEVDHGLLSCVAFYVSSEDQTYTYSNVTVTECYRIINPLARAGAGALSANLLVAPLPADSSLITDYTDGQRYRVVTGDSANAPLALAGYTEWQYLQRYAVRMNESMVRNFSNVWIARALPASPNTAPVQMALSLAAEDPEESCVVTEEDFEVLHQVPVPGTYRYTVRYIGTQPIPADKRIRVTVEVDFSQSAPQRDYFDFTTANAGEIQHGEATRTEPYENIGGISHTVNCFDVPPLPTPVCSLYQHKTPRFRTVPASPVIPPADLEQQNTAAEMAVKQQVTQSCESNAETWVQQLEDCLRALPANEYVTKRAALKTGFIEVCKFGGDPDHIMGASTTPPNTTTTPGGYVSFGDVIVKVLGTGMATSMDCNPWLIDGPAPYKVKTQAIRLSISALTPDICTKLTALQTEFGNGSGTFYQFVKNKYGDGADLTEAELNMLIKGCTNCRYLLEKDMKLPVFLEPGATGCVTAADYNAAVTAFNSSFNAAPDVNHPQYGRIFSSFMNQRWGFTLGYEDYMAYQQALQGDPSKLLCNKPAFGTVKDDKLSCLAGLVSDAINRGNYAYNIYIEEERKKFKQEYITLCSGVNASADLTGKQQVYHYTLYYYNQAGQLIRTVPPEGVNPLSDADVLKVQRAREAAGDPVCDGYAGPGTEGDKGVVNNALNQLMTGGGAMEYWLKGSGNGSLQALHTTTGETRYLVNTCISGNFLRIDLYQLEPSTDNTRINAVASRHTAVDISGSLPLTEWVHVVIQSPVLFSNDLKIFVNGKSCPATAAPPGDCDWEIIYTPQGFVYPENYTAIRHIRAYSGQLLPAQVAALAANNCLLEGPSYSRTIWERFNVEPGAPENDLPGGGVAEQPVYPDHKMATSYAYNTLGQVVQQKSPDAGISKFWYDYLGRLVLSQNAEQLAPSGSGAANRYSYTEYDRLGRIEEVGEASDVEASPGAQFLTDTQYGQVMDDAVRKDITRTVYDNVPLWIPSSIQPENLRKRVVASVFEETEDVRQHVTYYSYDQLGNVKSLWQQLDGMSQPKRIDYKYDLASGKVNAVRYQAGYNDRFIYGYEYDAENRLIKVKNGSSFAGWTILNEKPQALYSYYPHGPLSRMELGEHNIQGVDYAYTLQGWLKGVNGNFLGQGKDMGQDGEAGPRSTFASDVFAYSLNYFNSDYSPVENTVNPFPLSFNATGSGEGKDLFSGNIRGITVAMSALRAGAPVGYTYAYDQLNRLTRMRQQDLAADATAWGVRTGTHQPYAEDITYDANGNILSYVRKGIGTAEKPLEMDDLSYSYALVNGERSNRLASVSDAIGNSAYGNDLKGTKNYIYDKIGNLTAETSSQPAGTNNISWNVYGKIRSVTMGSNGSLIYKYDASGNRVSKRYTRPDGTDETTWYIRDAQGNTLATYVKKGSEAVKWSEQQLYGSSRLGYWQPDMTENGTDIDARWGAERNKRYELTNHLGNVMAVLNDVKGEVVSMQDYYPFGSAMPGRYGPVVNGVVSADVAGTGYRYGFNGKENDNEIKGEGNQQDYGFRIYDPRIGKFLSVDPLTAQYAYYTPYQFAGNKPIWATDLDGAEENTSSTYTNKPPVFKVATYNWFTPSPPQATVQADTRTPETRQMMKEAVAYRDRLRTLYETPQGESFRLMSGAGAGIVAVAEEFAFAWALAQGKRVIDVAKLLRYERRVSSLQVDRSALAAQYGAQVLDDDFARTVSGLDASVNTSTPTSTYLGGAKGSLFSKRNILEANHSPTMKSYEIAGFSISYSEGSAFQMVYAEHRAFVSTGSSKAAQAFRAQEASLLKQGKFMEAFDLNMNSIKSQFGNKYNEAMSQAREHFQKNIVPRLQKQLSQQP
ncbi:RHS repeat domain-containing protein [Chitinophaga sp. GCM10012297]|uniref:RHS repeat-associated core domain-containing protein n=1 Tax=Chitinophaga chungangae TaxID=2821488 RepID=A0ABS3YHB3_9BACT|nr:RHS repeat-associated core domain-containing protein [Chitinophaga chungangae]MBO9154071.1 hypothetical protein [Chitinophaga chungangae]